VVAGHECIGYDDKTASRLAPERSHDRFNFGIAVNGRHDRQYLERAGRCLK
jgi:hypothetical protein